MLNKDARKLPEYFNLSKFTKSNYEHIYNYDFDLDKKIKSIEQISTENIKIDKVLVDVECSHDGSLKHMLKYFTENSEKTKKSVKVEKPISNREKKRRAKQLKNSNKKSKIFNVLKIRT